MQITIDTKEMLGDETTIQDEVIEQVSSALIKAFKSDVERAVNKVLEKNIEEAAQKVFSEIAVAHLDTMITPTNEYGKQLPPYTLRNKIAEIAAASCVYKKAGYSSDRNTFTKEVDSMIVKEISAFKKEFNSLINQQLIQQSFEHAVNKLREACGIKK